MKRKRHLLPEYEEETSCMFCYLPPMIFDRKFDSCEYNHPKTTI